MKQYRSFWFEFSSILLSVLILTRSKLYCLIDGLLTLVNGQTEVFNIYFWIRIKNLGLLLNL
jgi:hypothetical protein